MIDYCTLGRTKSARALAAAITILFNTGLACAKDAHPPLSRFMGSVAGHNWTTQGMVDLILFFGLGLVLTKAGWTGRIKARRLFRWWWQRLSSGASDWSPGTRYSDIEL